MEFPHSLTGFLDENGIDISFCRGQSYDNASNMAGKYGGLQAKVKELCSYADFVPCSAHSLNLVGTCAAESCQQALLFFTFVAGLYNFFSASTGRWGKLATAISENSSHPLTVKKLSGTRWAERAGATQSVEENYPIILDVLEKLSNCEDQKAEVRLQAEGFLKMMNKLETGVMVIFWNKILQQFQKTSVSLQAEDLCLSKAYALYESLMGYVQSFKGTFAAIEEQAKTLTDCEEYEEEYRRPRRRNKRYDNEDSTETEDNLTASEKYKVKTFDVILECLHSELSKRQKAYKQLYKIFGVFEELRLSESDKLVEKSKKLASSYPDDLEESLADEMVQFSSLLKSQIASSINPQKNYEIQLYKLIKDKQLEATFPNVEIALRIFLSLMVSNCSGERSFSHLKRIKNELRSSMKQKRLNHLSLLNIEHELLREINIHDIIKDFANLKARKTAI